MTAIKVCREGSYVDRCELDDDLLNWGDDIREALLSTDEIARERGRVEIDTNHKNKLIIRGTLAYVDYVNPTSIIQMHLNKGKITAQSITITKNSRETEISMESLL